MTSLGRVIDPWMESTGRDICISQRSVMLWVTSRYRYQSAASLQLRKQADWVKNSPFPRLAKVVSQPEKREKKTEVGSKAPFSVSLLLQLLQQVMEGGFMPEKVMEEYSSILQVLDPSDCAEEGDQLQIDYTSKQLEDLCTQYYVVTSEASTFMVGQGKWGTCHESSPGLKMPKHILSEVDEKFVKVPMSWKFGDHIDAVLASWVDLKPSKASGLVQV